MILAVDVLTSVGYRPKFKFFNFDIVLGWMRLDAFDFWLSIFFVVGLFYRTEFIMEAFFLKSAGWTLVFGMYFVFEYFLIGSPELIVGVFFSGILSLNVLFFLSF